MNPQRKIMSFNNLKLHPSILKAVAEAGYTTPTTIQMQAIPKVIDGCDLRASAQTGTGKTAAFILPALNKLTTPSEKKGVKGPRVLILAPTRELAMQISTQAEKYSKYLDRVKTVCIFGGVPYHKQQKQLSRYYDILIATPGRLIDYIQKNKINFSRLEMLVLDEADRMLDMGFIQPVETIVAATPFDRQTLLFSATMQGSVLKLSEKLLNNPEEVVVHAQEAKHENITQTLHYTDDIQHKNKILEHVLNEQDLKHAIIFTSTKRHADQLSEELQDKGYEALALHGDMSQRQRDRTINRLRKGNAKIIVATDVAARGIDVQSITHVINFDLPHNVEDYVHRIGRTGRAGAKGKALSLAGRRDSHLVKKIEHFTKQPLDVVEIPGLEPKKLKTSNNPKPGNRKRNHRGFDRNRSNRRNKSNFEFGRGPKRKNARA